MSALALLQQLSLDKKIPQLSDGRINLMNAAFKILSVLIARCKSDAQTRKNDILRPIASSLSIDVEIIVDVENVR